MKNEDDMSYFERYSSSFSKGRQWGIDNVGSSCQQGKERKKSYGINPKRFHDGTRAAAITSSIHDVSGDDVINRKKKRCKSMIHTKQLLLEAKLRVDHNNVKRRFLALKDVSVCKCWPLQEPALKHLDELNQDYIKGPGRKVSSDEDLSGNKYSPLWSLEPRIFAIEKSAAGKRKYLVCHLGRFMHHYWRFCPHSSKHFYELIREGTPCRLYFDLEYNKKANPHITDEENEVLLDEFIAQLAVEIKAVYDIAISRKNIVDLDSSTEKKFSRHFIIHFPNGELFADAPTCGIFVKNLIGRLAEEVATGEMSKKHPTLAKYLFVQNKLTKACDENKQSNIIENSNGIMNRQNMACFVDSGVYTRNRLFRILGSVKYGKPPSAALRIASANQFPFPSGFGNEQFYPPAFVNNNDNNRVGKQLLNSSVKEDEEETMFDGFDYDKEEYLRKLKNWEKHAEALACTLVIPTHDPNVESINLGTRSQVNILQSPPLDEDKQSIDGQFEQRMKSMTTHGHHPSSRKRKMTSRTNRIGPTMFPSLDKFVLNTLGQRKHINGSIRAWTIESMISNENKEGNNSNNLRHSLITYHMKDNRWCENINRCHKSNNIMWNVSIKNGSYYQTCHDPDCRMASFQGQIQTLPSDVLCNINDVLFAKDLEVDDDFNNALLGINC